MEQIKTITRDVNLAAFLAVHGINPELQMQGQVVIFIFDKDRRFYELQEKFNNNALTPIADFIYQLKTLKSQMYALKGNGAGGQNGN